MWRTSYLQEAVWLGCNEVWPHHMSKEPGDRHIFFNYEYYLNRIIYIDDLSPADKTWAVVSVIVVSVTGKNGIVSL